MVTEAYDVPAATTEIYHEVLADERLKLPEAVVAAGDNVSFEGAQLPYLCVPFKFTEAISALKGLEAAFASAIAKERYGVDAGEARINTDHASLFVYSAFTSTINGMTALDPRIRDKIKDWDIKDSAKYKYRQMCTSVYKTKDGRFFHLHGSMYARPSMEMVGLDYDDAEKLKITERDDIVPIYAEAVGKWDAKEIDRVANDEYKQAGTICYSYDEFKQLEAGKAILDAPVYELYKAAAGEPVAWPSAPNGPKKALSGIKVLELTRVIAGPSIGKGLAEHGATVLRIVSSTQPDLHVIHPDLNQGKYVADLDLKTEEGKETLRRLIKDADVIVEGYRPGAIERLGFGREAVRKINPNIVYVRESCYGFHGPWQGRSGWQQIADCFTGLSYGFGEKLGLKDGESVVPIFPNSDFGAGASGLLGTMNALYRRATEGGVYNVDVALSYYDVWLMRLGYYPDSVWEQIRPTAKLRHHWEMYTMLPAVMPELLQRRPDVFTSPKYWHELDSPSYGVGAKVRTPRPIVKFDSGAIEVGVARGPVQNGTDPAEWPTV